ncbi:MAG: ABC transporter substrate-binding protein [Deltaproteobacteria bacterium]|nr:ABC transporter substrate-binding protein [Deltaproteobacteria bacterium]
MQTAYFIRAAALLLAVLACAAGCGRSDTDTIRLAYLQSDLHHLPAFIALEKGFFADEGLKVAVSGIFRAGPEMLSAFAAGELDVGYVGLAPAATAALNGVADISILAQVNIEGSAVVCRSGCCSTLAHLRDKTVAIPGHATMQDCLIQKGLRSAGLTPGMLRLMVLKPPEMLQSLRAGTIDCFIAWEPYPSQAFVEGHGEIVERSSGLWPQHTCCVLIAHGPFSRSRPDNARKILRAHERACRFIADFPAEALSIAERYTGMPRAVLEQAIEHMQFIPAIDREKVSAFEKFLFELGYVRPSRGTQRQLEFFQ